MGSRSPGMWKEFPRSCCKFPGSFQSVWEIWPQQGPCLQLMLTANSLYHYRRSLYKPQVTSRHSPPTPDKRGHHLSSCCKETWTDLMLSVSHMLDPLVSQLSAPFPLCPPHPHLFLEGQRSSPTLFYLSIHPGHSGWRDPSKLTPPPYTHTLHSC